MYSRLVMAYSFSLGSISHGTLRPADLIPEFVSECYQRNPKMSTWGDDVAELYKVMRALDVVEDDAFTDAFYESEYASGMVETLVEALNRNLPPFWYFGTHPGDGSDFGYWFASDAFEDACQYGEVVKLEQLPDSATEFAREFPEASYAAVISDHGNIELYGLRCCGRGLRFKHLYGVV